MDAQATAVFFGFFADLPDPRRHNVQHLFTATLTIAHGWFTPRLWFWPASSASRWRIFPSPDRSIKRSIVLAIVGGTGPSRRW